MIRYIAVLAFALLLAGVTLLLFTLPTPRQQGVDEMPATVDAAANTQAQGENSLQGTLLQNVRLIENGRLSEPQSILMEQGIITAIMNPEAEASLTENVAVIDGAGGTALPGLIDAHTHSYGSSLNDALRFGVTTSLDMFSDRALLSQARRARASRTATQDSDLFSAGMLATAPGGHGTQYGVAVEPLTAADQAEDWVRARKAEGSDYIKLVYIPNNRGFPSLDRPTARAVIEAAHAQGLLALVHISTRQAALEMIQEGVDGLVHVFADEPVNDELIQLALQRGVFVIPTLAVIEAVEGSAENSLRADAEMAGAGLSAMQQQTLAASFGPAIPGYRLEIALDNVRRLHAAGVPILAGSDAPNPGTAQGVSLHRELQLLVRAGMTEQQALDAATRLPAKLFSLPGRGVIETGAIADLVVIGGDPLAEIDATLSLQQVIKNGVRVERSLETPASLSLLTRDLLGDFESGLEAPRGFGWTSTDDGMVNGQSEVSIERVAQGAGDSAYALEIRSNVRAGFPYPWAGGAMMSSSGADISVYRALHFDVRGTPGAYRLMAFNEGAMGIPPTTNFTVTDDWQSHSVPLADLTGADWRRFIGFAWVAGPSPGESTIYLDNVRLVK